MKLAYGEDEYLMAAYRSSRVFAAALSVRFAGVKRVHPRLIGLSPFDADKTIRLLYKLWEARREIIDRVPSGDLLCSLPVYPDYNDKHGHRVAFANVKALPEDEKYTPALDAIEMFDRKAPAGNRMLSRAQTSDGYVVYVPQTSATDLTRDVMRGFLLPSDVAFVQTFGESAAELTEQQIVAIGRHETPAGTEESLAWELDWWRWWLAEALAEVSRVGDDPAYGAEEAGYKLWQTWSFALECIRKAGVDACRFVSDAEYYAEALGMLLRDSDKGSISPLLQVTHKRREQIWRDPRVGAKRLAAFTAWALSTYLCGCLRGSARFYGTRIASAFMSVEDTDVEAARQQVQKIASIPFDATPAHFMVEWLSSIAPSPAVQMPTVENVRGGGVDLTAFMRVVSPIIDTLVSNLVIPHTNTLEEEG